MAIGTAAAIGLGVASIGSALGASSSSKAAGKAADAQLATAKENNAFAQSMYDQNKGILSPFVNNGTTAGNYLNAFLGLPTQAAETRWVDAPKAGDAPAASGMNGFVGSALNSSLFSGIPSGQAQGAANTGGTNRDWTAYLQANPDVLQGYGSTDRSLFKSPEEYAQWHYANYGQGEGRQLPGVAQGVTQDAAQNAFGNYISNSDYGFQFATGANQLNSGYAGAGSLQSGAAMKGLEQYRQNLQSGYRNEYTGLLSGQQATGLAAGSALAGVGQNLTGTVTANNSNAANAASNAALIKGQNNPWANALGTIGGGLLGIGK